MSGSAVDWLPALVGLAAGIAVGVLFAWRVYARGRKPAAVAPAAPLELRDLWGKRDALVLQLREMEDTAAKRSPEQLATERYALELQAAEVLREIDRFAAAAPAPAKAAAAVASLVEPEPRRGNPALRGFLWGTGSAASIGLLLLFVARSAKERPEGGSLTGSVRPEGSAQASEPELAMLQGRLERDPDDLEARLELARQHLMRQDMMAVFNETQYVLQRSPGHPLALTYQSLVRLAMGQPDKAIAMLDEALSAEPDLIDAYLHKSLVYVRMGRFDDAEAAIDQASKRRPDQAGRFKELLAEMRSRAAVEGAAEALGGTRPRADPATAAPGGSVSGAVELDASARERAAPGAVLFVTVRPVGASSGPPLAVKRLSAGSFPVSFRIDQSDSMMGQALPERVRIEARVDADGDPLTRSPTDPSARLEGVKLGATDVRLVLR